MPTTKINDSELISRLTHVFRVYGYDGASLSIISEATGLQRASLYHRFPGGKEDMAEAVLAQADQWFVDHILAPLSEPGDPAERVKEMARRLSDFYNTGKNSCILDALSLGDATEHLRQHVELSFKAWLKAMTKIARESGLTAAQARERASDALVQIQGALVYSRAAGDTKPFRRVLDGLPELLTGKRSP